MKTLSVVVLIAASALATPVAAAGLQAGDPGFPGARAPSAATARHSCAQVQGLVNRHGHAVLTFDRVGSWLTGYGADRVVQDGRFCLHGEGTTPIWVPTTDSAACFAGYTCATGGEAGGRHGR